MGDVSAAAGAPIVSPDGVVESGNGRTIALRRAAAKGAPAYAQYKGASWRRRPATTPTGMQPAGAGAHAHQSRSAGSPAAAPWRAR